MAKAKYTRGEDGYFKTNVWTGEYKPDGTKKYKPLRSRKSSADLEKKKKEYEDAVRDRTMIRQSDITFISYAREWKKVYKGKKISQHPGNVREYHREASNCSGRCKATRYRQDSLADGIKQCIRERPDVSADRHDILSDPALRAG